MALDTVQLVTQVGSAVGEVTVLALMLRRNVWRTLPFFCAYIGWALITDISSYLMRSTPPAAYLRYYLFESTLDFALQFIVLVELGWSVLRPVRASLPRGALAALAGMLALAGLVIWPLAGSGMPAAITGPHDKLLFHLEETFAILRVASFLVMASFSQLLSIGWRDRELQVATGLGFYSIVSLLVVLLHSHQSTDSLQYHKLDVMEAVSYLCTLSYWVLCFATKEQKRKEFSPQMQHLLVLMGGGARTNRIALTDLPSKRSRTKD